MLKRVGQTLFSGGLVNILIRKNFHSDKKALIFWTKTKTDNAIFESFFGELKYS